MSTYYTLSNVKQLPEVPDDINSYEMTRHTECFQVITKLLNGETIYVTFPYDFKRKGSIGKIDSESVKISIDRGTSNTANNMWYSHRSGSEHYAYMSFDIIWDGRKNRVANNHLHLGSILLDHKGPTVWAYNKDAVENEVEPQDVKDRLGRQINVGDIAVFAQRGSDGGTVAIHFGSVTKITKDGIVWCQNFKLAEKDEIRDRPLRHTDEIIVYHEGLSHDVMMKKLTL